MLWMGILYISCIIQVNLEETNILNKYVENKKNMDEVDNDILFNYHKLMELKRNRKRKRSAQGQLPNTLGVVNAIVHYAALPKEYPLSESNDNPFLPAFEQPRVTEDASFYSELTPHGPILCEENYEELQRTEGSSNDLMDLENDSDLKDVAVCDMEHLVTYLAEMQATNPENIVNLASEQDLDALCDKAVNTLDNIDTYIRTCNLPTEQDLYLQLIEGVRSLSDKLCFDRSFRSEFLKRSPCISQLHGEYQDCVGPTDWVEDPNSTVVCQTYKDIAECYNVKTNAGCGEDSADIMRSLLYNIMDSVVPVKCGGAETLAKRKTSESSDDSESKNQRMPVFANKAIPHMWNTHLLLIAILLSISESQLHKNVYIN